MAERWLAAVARRLPGLELRLICDRSVELPGLRVVPRPWSSDTEAEELAAADIGISWLPDDQFSRGKCGLKVLQYMAAGLPVIANPVGVHPQMVVHGGSGLLASTPDEWADAVVRLAADPALRARMGRDGRHRVEQHYSVERWGPQFAGLLDAVVARRALGEQPRGLVFQEACGLTAAGKDSHGNRPEPSTGDVSARQSAGGLVDGPLEAAGMAGGLAAGGGDRLAGLALPARSVDLD